MAMKKDFGAFELHEKIGSGGMASVYRGVQKSLDRRVVLKVLYPHLAEDEKLVQRFEREARAAAMLRHENIVQVIDCGRYEDVSYIAMEFVDGMDLKKWMEAHGPPPIEMALLMLRDLCAGLEHAHQHRIVHRDIKPANIMFTPDGTLKIMDFGLARRGEDSTAVTVVGSVLGTPAYMSPEQATGEAVDERSDIFSAGVVGYELLGSQRPFSGDSYSTVLRAVLTVEPPRLEEVNPLVPQEIVNIIHRMLQKDVSKRYPKISQVRGELETVIDQLGLNRSRDILREYAQEPERVAETLKKKRLSRHMDQGLYFENMGRGKIDDAIMEYRRVVYLDPENRGARDKLKKLEAERRTLQTLPDGGGAAEDPGVTMVMSPEDVAAAGGRGGASPPAKPATPSRGATPPRPAPVRAAKPAAPADKAAGTRNLLIGAVAILVVLIAVVVFVLMRGGGEKNSVAANPPTAPSAGGPSTTSASPGGARAANAPPPPAPATPSPATPAPGGAAQALGSLEVTTDPPSARITLNGKAQSKRSNTTLPDVDAGTVSVRVEKDGYLPQARSVDVPSGGVGHISFTLEPNPNQPGTLEIHVTPFATYFINEQQVAANVASTKQQLKPGVYSIRAVHPAFDPKEWKNIRVEPGKTLTLAYDFIAGAQVTLRISSDPWAEVIVDGQKTGKFTPCEIVLPAGTKSVSVAREGFVMDGAAKSVTLKSGTPTSVSFTLHKK